MKNQALLTALIILIAGCVQQSSNNQIANPASTNCIEKGYNLTLRNETGYCIFPNGNECEEWAFYRNKCTNDTKTNCEYNNGTWDTEFNECLGITSQACTTIGGDFNECASACRHDPNAQVCTLQCVIVCEL